MFSGIWDKMKGAAKTAWEPMANAYDNAMAPDDDLLADLADAEAGGAVAAHEAGSEDQKKALAAIDADDKSKRDAMKQAGAMMARMGGGGGGEQTFARHQGGPKGGGTNIQTEDQYAMAMKALTDKYGKFMFNQNF